MLQIFLEIPFPIPKCNIELRKDKFELLEQPNFINGETALFSAVRGRKTENMIFLLSCGSNVLHKNILDDLAIDIAYTIEDWGSMLILLKNGSPFPKKFDIMVLASQVKVASEFPNTAQCNEILALQEFCNAREEYVGLIKAGNIEGLIDRRESGVVMDNFRGCDNHSAPYYAFLARQHEAYALLRTQGFKIFDYEDRDLDISLFSDEDKGKIQFFMNKWGLV
jgi:hypothetical protein